MKKFVFLIFKFVFNNTQFLSPKFEYKINLCLVFSYNNFAFSLNIYFMIFKVRLSSLKFIVIYIAVFLWKVEKLFRAILDKQFSAK